MKPPATLLALLACAFVAAAPDAPPKRKIVTVKTAEAFIEAIGPDREIRLEPGEYVLSHVKDRHMKYVRRDREFDGNFQHR